MTGTCIGYNAVLFSIHKHLYLSNCTAAMMLLLPHPPLHWHVMLVLHASSYYLAHCLTIISLLSLLLQTENIRIAYIDQIAPGESTVSFKLFIPQEQYDLGPLNLKGFKATGFPGKMLPGQGSGLIGAPRGGETSDCDILGTCDEAAEEALIR